MSILASVKYVCPGEKPQGAKREAVGRAIVRTREQTSRGTGDKWVEHQGARGSVGKSPEKC